MPQQVRYQLWIVAAAGMIFFTNLGGAALWDMDEALYSSCAREMFQRGDWVVPMFNGQMFPEKPPLMFWTMIGGFELFGAGELGARFFSAVFGVATALLAFHLGRILLNARVGLWAGLITASTIIFTVSARAATVDSGLTLATAAAFLWFVIALKESRNERSSSLSLKLRYAIPMYACIGVAVLAKGPVGMLLPLAAMGLYLLVVNGWRNAFRSAWWMRPVTAIVVVAAVALPWYVWVGVRTDGEWLRKFFIEFNLRPFRQPILTHGDTSFLNSTLAVAASILYFFYHIPAILVGFFPWSVFLGPTLIDAIARIRHRGQTSNINFEPSSGSHALRGNLMSSTLCVEPGDAERRGRLVPTQSVGTRVCSPPDGCVLASCWFGVWLAFWSICRTKLPHYLLPAYPALALLTACFVDRWQSAPASVSRWALRNAWISLILVGVGMMIAVPIVTSIYLPGQSVLGLLGLIPLLGGGWCWWQTAHERHQRAAVGLACTAVVFLTAVFGWGALRVDRYQNAKPMIAKIRADSGQSGQTAIATYHFFRESIVYYAGHPITRCEDDEKTGQSASEKLREFLAKPKPRYVITLNEYLPGLDREFPGQFQEIFRQRCFGDIDANCQVIVLRAK